MDDITFSDYIVTCRNDGCENGNIPITVSAPSISASFICGPCSQPITDIISVTE